MTNSPETENEALNTRNELKVNEMEQVTGGNFFANLEDVLRRMF